MKTLKKYILAITTLLMLPTVAWAVDVSIMGIDCIGNATITPSTTTSPYTFGVGGLTPTDGMSVSKPVTSDDISVTAIPIQIYDGTNAVTPMVYIYDNGTLLTKDVDYTVSYASNEAEGEGSVTITGTGGYYSGSRSLNFYIVKEYFSEGGISYHTISSTAVAVGNSTHTAATALTGVVTVPDNITHELDNTHVTATFTVTGIETGAFKNCTGIKGINMENNVNLQYIEDGAFEGCTALRYIDLSSAKNFTPSTLLRFIEASPFYGVPKQALVYLNGTTFVGENYVYKLKTSAEYRCDVLTIYDDLDGNQKGFEDSNDYKWPFENRHDFMAYTIVNTRKLTCDQHYTTCLPYNLPIPEGMKAYTLNATSDKMLGFKEVTGELEACHPYVIIPSVTGLLLSATNVEVPAFTATDDEAKKLNPINSATGSTSTFTMGGTMRYIDGPDAADFYIMQGLDANGVCTWKKIESAASNTTASPANPCVLPMRAYIKSGAALSRPLLESSFVNGVSETTPVVESPHLFDLQGRQVQGSQRKGIYIRNGCKVIL